MEIPVQLPYVVESVHLHKVLQELVKHVLFFHNQAPGPVDDLMREFQVLDSEGKPACHGAESSPVDERRHQKRRRVTTVERRGLKFVSAVQAFLRVLQPEMLNSCGAEEILLVLGASPTRARVAFNVQLSNRLVNLETPAEPEDPAASSQKKSKEANECARRVIRSLITAGIDAPDVRGPLKLFVLLRAPASSPFTGDFLPKRHFLPLWRKGKKKIHPTVIQLLSKTPSCASSLVQLERDPQVVEGEVNDKIWYQCKYYVKGLRIRTPDSF
ncbi:hypothetical protein CYMTET_6167 [Cymbomonas tetramitiformis]|uniref:Uncharacterized protein n=1 Tax=Cymbomonas tetramitiformis TaxID=36881 RepID=A0AAE0GXP2_9CHLO|nr:hypothetical protein CYMTET_6167 [Cymbomonas tetramitiformis]